VRAAGNRIEKAGFIARVLNFGEDIIPSVFSRKLEVVSMETPERLEGFRGYSELYAGGFVCETPPPAPGKPRLLDQVREEIRKRHYSRRTEKTYIGWIRRFILFHGKRHPSEMGEVEISSYLSHLAVAGREAKIA
jgi:hypothetical protein